MKSKRINKSVTAYLTSTSTESYFNKYAQTVLVKLSISTCTIFTVSLIIHYRKSCCNVHVDFTFS